MDLKLMKLGKKAPVHDERTLRMADYLVLPKSPDACYWMVKGGMNWGMMANDRLGCCTCAAIGHFIQIWTSNVVKEITLTDAQIIQLYEKFCGYNPKDPNTDQGGVELDVLNGWRKFTAAGHTLDAYVANEPHNHEHVRASIHLFGGAYIGVSLPLSAQGQKVWSVPPGGLKGKGAPGSWGGHAVVVGAYDATGLTCITWGAKMKMTWGFWDAYCDESYALLSKDWFVGGKVSPDHFDYAALSADLKAVAA